MQAPHGVELDRRVGAVAGGRGLVPRPVRQIKGSHRPAQPAKYGGILRQDVGPAQPVQLEQVFGAAQEPVGGGQFLRVGAADVAASGQRRQRRQRRGLAQRLVGAAVHELQELDSELDVAQSAGTELQLAPGLPGGQRLLHPAAHGLGVLDEVLATRRLPDQRGERVRVGLAEGHVTRHRAGLEQRLELPGLGPALVVGPVAGQGADQRALAAFGPEVRVDGEDAALGRGPRADADQARGQTAGGGQRRGLVPGPGRAGDRLGDEDHVDVAGVVQLAGAALAHGHHGEPARRGPGGQLGPGHGERRLEHPGGDVGQFLDHIFHGDDRGHVARRQKKQPPPVRRGQRRRRLGVGFLAGHRLGQARVRADGPQHFLTQFGRVRTADGGAQQLGVAGVPGQVVGQAGADAEDGGQPVAEVGFVAQCLAQGGRVVRDAAHPGQPGQGQVGIGRGGQRGQQRVGGRIVLARRPGRCRRDR